MCSIVALSSHLSSNRASAFKRSSPTKWINLKYIFQRSVASALLNTALSICFPLLFIWSTGVILISSELVFLQSTNRTLLFGETLVSCLPPQTTSADISTVQIAKSGDSIKIASALI